MLTCGRYSSREESRLSPRTFRTLRLLAAIMAILPLLAPWLASPVGAAIRPFEGSVVCGDPCGAQQASDGRWILTLVTDALGPPPRPVTLDVTEVIRDLPRIEPGDFLSFDVDDVPNAQGRYLAKSINKPRDGQETSDRDEQPEQENEDNPSNSAGAPQPTLSLALSSPTLAEAGGSTILTVTLPAPQGQPVTVTLAFTGSAGDGVDYTRRPAARRSRSRPIPHRSHSP